MAFQGIRQTGEIEPLAGEQVEGAYPGPFLGKKHQVIIFPVGLGNDDLISPIQKNLGGGAEAVGQSPGDDRLAELFAGQTWIFFKQHPLPDFPQFLFPGAGCVRIDLFGLQSAKILVDGLKVHGLAVLFQCDPDRGVDPLPGRLRRLRKNTQLRKEKRESGFRQKFNQTGVFSRQGFI